VVLYTQALRLCPRGFRADFGHEMRAVFVQAIETRAGTGQALSFLLRELEDLPGSLLRQHWLTIRKEQDPMTPLARIERYPDRRAPTWNLGGGFPG
jgi:hypothetical protein